MPKQRLSRDCGDLLCYALKDLYLKEMVKTNFRFTAHMLVNRAQEIIKDGARLNEFKREFGYNDSEIESIKKKAEGYRSFSIQFSKLIKIYEDKSLYGAGYIDPENTVRKYRLNQLIVEALDKNFTVGNAQMENHRSLKRLVESTKSAEPINPKRQI